MMPQAVGRRLEELPDLLVAIKGLPVDCTGIHVGVFCKQGQGRIPVLAIAGIAVMLAVSLSRRLGISGHMLTFSEPVSYRIAVGPQQGRKAFMIRTIRPLDRPDPGLERVAKANGFSLHAGVSCEGHQKNKRERLFRYIARPAVAIPRLSLSSTGKVIYTLKTSYRDGTTQVAFEGAAFRTVDFIARLAALARARSDPNRGST